MEWRFERRRGSSVDRKNTVRHLIQMMAITESEKEDQVGSLSTVADNSWHFNPFEKFKYLSISYQSSERI